MRTLYVLIKCRLGTAYDVAGRIVDVIEETGAVHSISGAFDLIARFDVDRDADIGRFVNHKLHAIADIVDTQTMICFDAFMRDKGIGAKG